MSLLLPLLARDSGWGASTTGIVAGTQGLGIVAVTAVVSRWGGARMPGTAASGGLALAAIGQAGLVLAAWTSAGERAAVAAAAVGVGSGLFTAHLAPLVLGSAPRTHLARVQALVGLVQVGALTVTNPLLGALAGWTSPGVAGGVCAAGLLVCAILGTTALRRLTVDAVEGSQA
jgi:hypothetical protein